MVWKRYQNTVATTESCLWRDFNAIVMTEPNIFTFFVNVDRFRVENKNKGLDFVA
jgi:hypothetical protein